MKENTDLQKTTDFGYQQVPVAEKAQKVAGVFHSVAKNYDLMNDLMSLGIHRLWKHFAITISGVRPGQRVLDLASGTGDLALKLAKQVKQEGVVVLADINESMLNIARERLTNQGIVGNVEYVIADAERLPFSDNEFDIITIAFGLRNVTDKMVALNNLYRILKPGGQVLILEFSKPTLPALQPLYDWYSFKILPFLGKIVANDAESYRYLAESIRRHPDQTTLKSMLEQVGFVRCDYHNLTAGVVALHRGYK
ncbi:MAG: bifunctional demethylmenaquinone methyltransferase/2-methoxy-6-polyprenyl-1,4-benzoquinol methylase UbiE [Gammaproteobacteria bacterium]